jgi:hypothetical protein
MSPLLPSRLLSPHLHHGPAVLVLLPEALDHVLDGDQQVLALDWHGSGELVPDQRQPTRAPQLRVGVLELQHTDISNLKNQIQSRIQCTTPIHSPRAHPRLTPPPPHLSCRRGDLQQERGDVLARGAGKAEAAEEGQHVGHRACTHPGTVGGGGGGKERRGTQHVDEGQRRGGPAQSPLRSAALGSGALGAPQYALLPVYICLPAAVGDGVVKGKPGHPRPLCPRSSMPSPLALPRAASATHRGRRWCRWISS